MKKTKFESAQVVKEKREEQKLLLGMQAEQERKLKKRRKLNQRKNKAQIYVIIYVTSFSTLWSFPTQFFINGFDFQYTKKI